MRPDEPTAQLNPPTKKARPEPMPQTVHDRHATRSIQAEPLTPLPPAAEWHWRANKEWLQAPVGTEGSMVAEWRGIQCEGIANLWSPEEQ
eukprot:4180394-Prorocentrum_lima.AAC.1